MLINQIFSELNYSVIICNKTSELDFHASGCIQQVLLSQIDKRLIDFVKPYASHISVTSLTAFTNRSYTDYVVSIKLSCSTYTFIGIGRDETFCQARDQSLMSLIRKMLSNCYFFMPRILYSIPNPDGYCFLNSTLMLLLYSPNFIQKLLFAIYLSADTFYDYNDVIILEEEPVTLVIQPRNELDDVRVAYLLKELYHELVYAGINQTDSMAVNDRLSVIRRQLIQHFAQKIHPDWFYPNGHVQDALRTILKEITNFCKGILDDLLIKMEGCFNCNHCGRSSGLRYFWIKFLVVPPKIMLIHRTVSLNSILSDPKYWVDSIEEVCGYRTNDGIVCNGRPLGWTSLRCLKFPSMFLISYVTSPDFKNMRLNTDANIIQIRLSNLHSPALYYSVRGYTITFQTYRSPGDVHRGDRYGANLVGDIPDEYHSVACLAAIDSGGTTDYVECNNGNIYHCNPMLRYIQPGSLWIYSQTDPDSDLKSCWLPNVMSLM